MLEGKKKEKKARRLPLVRSSLSWPVLQGETCSETHALWCAHAHPLPPLPHRYPHSLSYQSHLPRTQPGTPAHGLWPLPCSVPLEDPPWPHPHPNPVVSPDSSWRMLGTFRYAENTGVGRLWRCGGERCPLPPLPPFSQGSGEPSTNFQLKNWGPGT